jgi:hypothetical protein
MNEDSQNDPLKQWNISMTPPTAATDFVRSGGSRAVECSPRSFPAWFFTTDVNSWNVDFQAFFRPTIGVCFFSLFYGT